MRVLLVNNRFKKSTAEVAGLIAAKLEARQVDVVFDDGSQASVTQNIDIIVVLGGDGTILRTARQYGHRKIPMLGVNMGTVGFLSNIEVNEFDQYLDRLIEGNYIIDERMMLEVSIYSGKNLVEKLRCLNEVVIKSQTPRMVTFNLNVAGQKMAAYRGDGLIVATPTGSTAYSLSSGGPIVDPDLEALVVTPIAPHVISKRPLVVSPDKLLSLTCVECQDAIACVDGQVRIDFEPDYHLKVKKAGHKLKLIDLKNAPFFTTVETRLRRSEDVR